MDNQKNVQEIRLLSRKHFDVNGVKEVESFDEESVVLRTLCGLLNVDGKELKISVLDIDKGIVSLDGRVDAVYFSDEKDNSGRGLFGRLLR